MKPTIGRIVHYVQTLPPHFQHAERKVVHLPAVITAVWSETCVNLQVFTDGANSEIDGTNFRSIKWVTSVTMDGSADPQQHSWHWPELS